MIAYLDTSALVRLYVVERGSKETIAWIARALVFATFDRRLWEVARVAGLEPWPASLGRPTG